jgi:ParB family transcriptional regulator, chromosome partitioning protein
MQLEFHQLEQRFEHLRASRPDRQRQLLASLAESGQQTPIVVVALANQPNRYLVIDGYKRIAALKQLGRDTVEAVVWPMNEAQALVLDRSMRLSQRETALEEGWLLAELEERFGYGPQELGRLFDRSISWVMRRLALVELLPESVQQQVREGKFSAHMAIKHLAAVARVSLDDCLRMADAFARHGFNTRQASELYRAWREGSPLTRERILGQPELYLKAREQVEQQAPATPAAELMGDLEMVVAITKRASRRVSRAALEMNLEQCVEARRQIERALVQLNELAKRIPGEQQHVEQREADGDSGTRGSGSEPPPDRPSYGYLPSDGAPSRWFELVRSTPDREVREGLALPAADPRALEELQGEPGPGP